MINGLIKYVNEELNAGTNNTFILKLLLKFLNESKDTVMGIIKEKFGGIIKMFNLMDENDNFNITKIYEVAKDTMEDSPYKFETILGNLVITPADIERIYILIKGA